MLRIDSGIFLTIINLLILFVAMYIFLFKPVRKIIAARQEEAETGLNEAIAKQKEADQLKEEYDKSLADIEDEKRTVLADARKKADEEYQKVIESARKDAEDIKAEAVSGAEREKAQIIKEAEKEIAEMIVEATEKAVAIHRGEEEDAALYNKFLGKAGDEA